MSSILHDLVFGGGRSATFETPGDTITGTLNRIPEERQVTEFGTGSLETWDDGKPKLQVVISLQTEHRVDADDDGRRRVFIKTWGEQWRAFRAAVSAAGDLPDVGDDFTATFTGWGDKPIKGGHPAKLYEYRISKRGPAPEPEPEAWAVAGDEAPPWEQPQPDRGTLDTPTGKAVDQARQLLATNLLDDQQIAAATGLAPLLIKRLRETNR